VSALPCFGYDVFDDARPVGGYGFPFLIPLIGVGAAALLARRKNQQQEAAAIASRQQVEASQAGAYQAQAAEATARAQAALASAAAMGDNTPYYVAGGVILTLAGIGAFLATRR
jgi:hypothetical protein